MDITASSYGAFSANILVGRAVRWRELAACARALQILRKKTSLHRKISETRVYLAGAGSCSALLPRGSTFLSRCLNEPETVNGCFTRHDIDSDRWRTSISRQSPNNDLKSSRPSDKARFRDFITWYTYNINGDIGSKIWNPAAKPQKIGRFSDDRPLYFLTNLFLLGWMHEQFMTP